MDYPGLWGYARDLYQLPGFGDTTDFDQIKRHYYQTQDWINPSRIVPKGPYVNWLSPHDRDAHVRAIMKGSDRAPAMPGAPGPRR